MIGFNYGIAMRRLILAFALISLTGIAPISASADDAVAAPKPDLDPDQAIKCRKVEVTGSLVKKGKVCKTVAEWKRIIDNGNRVARAVWEQGAKPTNGTFIEP